MLEAECEHQEIVVNTGTEVAMRHSFRSIQYSE